MEGILNHKEGASAETQGRTYTVINAARRGLSTIGEVHLYAHHVARLKPDVVVLGVFMANDLNYNLLHSDSEKLVGSELLFMKLYRKLQKRSALFFLSMKSAALNSREKFFGRFGMDAWRWIPGEFRIADENGFVMANYLHGEVSTYVVPESEVISKSYDLFKNELLKLKKLIAENGARLLVVILPTHSSLVDSLSLLIFPSALQDLQNDDRHWPYEAKFQTTYATC